MARLGLSAEEKAGSSVDELLRLKGEALVKAVPDFIQPLSSEEERPKLSMDDLLRVLAALPPDLPGKSDSEFASMHVVERIAQQAADGDLDRLLALYRGGYSQKSWRDEFLFAMAKPWIMRELEKIAAEQRKPLVLGSVGIDVPANLKAAPKEVMASWQLFTAAMAPFRRTFEEPRLREPLKERPWIPFFSNPIAFKESVDSALFGQSAGAAERLPLFEWGPSCGVGSEALCAPRNLAIFISLLRQRRLAEAIGASLQVMPIEVAFSESLPPLNLRPDFRRRLLEICGIPWDRFYLGALLDDFWMQWAALRWVVEDGPDEAIQVLAKGFAHLPENRRDEALAAIGAVLYPSRGPTGWVGRETTVRKEPVLPATRAELVRAIAATLRRVNDGYSGETFVIAMRDFPEPEVKEVLRELLRHESDEVAEAAANVLRGFGEEVPAAQVLPPVLFKVLVNGQPLRSKMVKVEVHRSERYTSASVGTDREGLAAVEGKSLSPRKGKVGTIRFSLQPESLPSSPAPLTSAPAPAIPGLEDDVKKPLNTKTPWFSAEVPPLASLPGVHPVYVTAYPLALRVVLPAQPPAPASGKEIRVRVCRRASKAGEMLGFMDFVLQRQEPKMELSAVQAGSYEIEIEARGAATWKSGVFALEGPKTLEAKLLPGTDVRFKLTKSDTGETTQRTYHLMRNAERLVTILSLPDDTGALIVRSLPPGSYVLRVLPTAEEKWNGELDKGAIQIDEEPEYAGVEAQFEVIAGAVSTLDLGTLVLQRLK